MFIFLQIGLHQRYPVFYCLDLERKHKKISYYKVVNPDMDCIGVKANDIRVWVDSKVFYGVFPWTKLCKPVTWNHRRPLPSSGTRIYGTDQNRRGLPSWCLCCSTIGDASFLASSKFFSHWNSISVHFTLLAVDSCIFSCFFTWIFFLPYFLRMLMKFYLLCILNFAFIRISCVVFVYIETQLFQWICFLCFSDNSFCIQVSKNKTNKQNSWKHVSLTLLELPPPPWSPDAHPWWLLSIARSICFPSLAARCDNHPSYPRMLGLLIVTQ